MAFFPKEIVSAIRRGLCRGRLLRYPTTMTENDDSDDRRAQPAPAPAGRPDVRGPKPARPKNREDRLKAELRANLMRRKIQARARREGAEDGRDGSLLGQRPDEE
jgi:hypothetical protein